MKNIFNKEYSPALILSLIYFFIFYFINSSSVYYGYFRDELYYFSCADRLAFGFIDHPPLSIFILKLWKTIFGTSLYSIRFLPTLIGSSLIFISGYMVYYLNGGKLAQIIACLITALVPVFVSQASFYSMNALELIIWAILILLFVKYIKTNDQKLWIYIGIFFGLGLQNKHTSITFIFAILFSLLFTPQRTYLKSKYFWYGMGIGILIFLPNLIWQISNNFVSLEFYREATRLKNVDVPVLQSILMQVLIINAIFFIICLTGLYYFIFNKEGKLFKALSFSYLIMLFILMASKSSRPDRIGGMYIILIVGGAIVLERFLNRFKTKWIKYAILVLIFLLGSFDKIAVSPIMPPSALANLLNSLGIKMEFEKGNKPSIPQNLADRIGWEEQVKAVAEAYNTLSVEEKKDALIAATNYGQAGALEFFGKKYNLPPVICGHNSYWHWRTYNRPGKILISLGRSKEDLSKAYDEIIEFPIYKCDYTVPYETNLRIFVCKKFKLKDLKELWQTTKKYI